jgi:phospholipid transport system substrate-binding protein
MVLRRLIKAVVVTAALFASFSSHPAAAADEAKAVVEQFQAGLLGIMLEAKPLGFSGRRDRLEQVLGDTFDQEHIARVVLGNYWADMHSAKRKQIQELMFRFATTMLAKNFDEYDNERIETQFARPLKSGNVRVRSHFHLGGTGPVMADFVLHKTAERWRIINFWFSGVSGTQIYRAEFQAAIANGGTKALIAALEKKIAKLGNPKS